MLFIFSRFTDYFEHFSVLLLICMCPVSQWAFHEENGGRPGAAKVMVVVTDGESHDFFLRDTVIQECEKQGITRFGIAVRKTFYLSDVFT